VTGSVVQDASGNAAKLAANRRKNGTGRRANKRKRMTTIA
jgi:hypothetical protein